MTKYDTLAEEYFQRRENFKRFDYNRDIEVPSMINFIGNIKNKKILDLGSGFGDHAEKISLKKPIELIGLDKSKELIKIAKNKKIPNSFFYVGDMEKKLKHSDNYFDIVYSSLAIHYVNNLDNLFKEVNRVLKINGFFCFSTGHPIFNLINQSNDNSISIKKTTKNKIVTNCNYFDESKKSNNLGSLGKVKLYNYTFQTLIKSGLNNAFQLVDYLESKPVKKSIKYDSEKYKLTNTLPTFILFKFKKL